MIEQGDSSLHGMLQAGIAAAKAKQKPEAYRVLKQVVERDPQSEQGWLWLGAVASTPAESLDAFGHVLAINPANEQAREGQRWALSRLTRSVTTTPSAATPSPAGGALPDEPAAQSAASGPDTAPIATAQPDTAPIATVQPDTAPVALAQPVTAPVAAAVSPKPSRLTAPLVMPADQPSEAAQPEIIDWRSDGDLTVEPDAFDFVGHSDQRPTFVPAIQPAQPAPYIEAARPVGSRASMVPLMLGAVVLLAGILLAAYGLFASASSSSYFDNVGQKFFQAQLAKNYEAASGYLTPQLQQTYRNAGNDLPPVKLTQTLAGLASPTVEADKPLATASDGSEGRSTVTISSPTSDQVRYLVSLTHASGKWLITGISSYPAAP